MRYKNDKEEDINLEWLSHMWIIATVYYKKLKKKQIKFDFEKWDESFLEIDLV